MPRNQYSRKTSGRQLSKTELLIEQESKDARRAYGQQRRREYLARQQRRDNKARRAALNTSTYTPTWKLERERQHALIKKHNHVPISFNILVNEDDDDTSLRHQEQQQYRGPRPVKVSAYSGGNWRNVALKSSATVPTPAKPADKPSATVPTPAKPADKPADKPYKPAAPVPTPAKPADKPSAMVPTPAKPADKPSAMVPTPKAALTKTGWDSDTDDDDDAWPTLEISNWADEV
jgi:hypothetical protein